LSIGKLYSLQITPSIRVNFVPVMPDASFLERTRSLSIRSRPSSTPSLLHYSHSYLALPCLALNNRVQHRHFNFNLHSALPQTHIHFQVIRYPFTRYTRSLKTFFLSLLNRVTTHGRRRHRAARDGIRNETPREGVVKGIFIPLMAQKFLF
jgi:hypothetical protein